MLRPAIERPLPQLLWLLLLALPGIWYLAAAVEIKLRQTKSANTLHVIGSGLAIWLLTVHVVSLLVGDFSIGLIAGTIAPGVAGYSYRISKGHITFQPSYKADYVVAAVCSIVVLPAIVFWDFHDSRGVHYSTHFSIVEQILNGIYPPRDLAFAEYVIGYHYGVDTLFACIAAMLNLGADMAINVITFLLWFFSALLFAKIGRHYFDKTGAIIFPLIGCFAGGFPWLLGEAKSWTWALLGLYEVGGSFLNPPLTSYFFQYPWAIGIPFALLCFDLLSSNKPSSLLLALYLLVIGVSNTTLLLTLAPTFLALFGLRFVGIKDGSRANALYSIVAVALSVVLSLKLSGFSSVLSKSSGHLALSANGIADGLVNSLLWNAATFGPLLVVGAVGLFQLKDLKLILALLIAGGVVVVNAVTYKHSWDIVKFATVSQLALAISAAGAVCYLYQRKKSLALSLALLLISPGFAFHGVFWRGVSANEDSPMAEALWRSDMIGNLSEDNRRAMEWLRAEISAGELVLVPRKSSLAYAHLGGIPQFWITAVTRALGFPEEDLNRRESITREFPPNAQTYAAEGVRWVVFESDGRDPVSQVSNKMLANGELKEKIRFGSIVIGSFVIGDVSTN